MFNPLMSLSVTSTGQDPENCGKIGTQKKSPQLMMGYILLGLYMPLQNLYKIQAPSLFLGGAVDLPHVSSHL